MNTPLYHVDAFTDRTFAGNPAAVCLLEEPAEPAWMQAVAREMNLSETAFVSPEGDEYRLRWFTPAVEVDLCGHATLASAHVLWEAGRADPGVPVRFRTASGLLTAAREEGWITLDFPALPAEPASVPAGLTAALGVDPVAVYTSRFDLLVELPGEAEVRALRPDMARLAAVEARGIIVTAPSGMRGFDFVSRFFGPAVGVPEDPVTGSAHSVLGPFWQERLGRPALVGYQASARGGVVRVRVQGQRALISGQAVTVVKGELVPVA